MGSHTDLYRCYSKDGRLLYVGISCSAIARFSQHKAGSLFARQVAKIEIEKFGSRVDALNAEADAIKNENPKFNKAHKTPTNKQIEELMIKKPHLDFRSPWHFARSGASDEEKKLYFLWKVSRLRNASPDVGYI